MTDEPTPAAPDPDDAPLAAALRDVLQDEASADDVPPIDENGLAYVRHRAAARRRTKVAGLTAGVVVLVLLSGTALAVNRTGGGRSTADLASAGSGATGAASSAASNSFDSTTVTATVPVPGTAFCEPQVGPPPPPAITVPCPRESAVPECGDPGCDVPTTETTVPPTLGPTTVPSTTHPLPTATSEPPTMPPTSATPGVPIDCGSSTPSGWPTTTMSSPTLAQCILQAFAAGTPATLHVSRYTTGEPEHPVIWDYLVIGPLRVQVTTDATRAADRPPGITVETCTSLVADPSNVVVAGGCTG